MSDHPLFTLASNWETVEADARAPLKEVIMKLVKYPCQIACTSNNGAVDIVVFSLKKNKITDWIEIQADGALGVIFDMYEKSDPQELSDRCEDYNASIHVVFQSDSESESGSDTGSDTES